MPHIGKQRGNSMYYPPRVAFIDSVWDVELAAVFRRGASVLHSPRSRSLHPPLPASLPGLLSGFQPRIRGEAAESHPRGGRNDTPLLPLLPPFISSDLSRALAGGPSAFLFPPVAVLAQVRQEELHGANGG